MCYRVVERYSVCRCLYYKHSIDMCAAANQQGHIVQEKTILVGYLCDDHSSRQSSQHSGRSGSRYSDSGYGSRDRHSSSRHRRWNILSSITGVSWQSSALVQFEFQDWVRFMFSFRRRHSSTPPSQLTLLLTGQNANHPASAPWFFLLLQALPNLHLSIFSPLRIKIHTMRCHERHVLIEGAKEKQFHITRAKVQLSRSTKTKMLSDLAGSISKHSEGLWVMGHGYGSCHSVVLFCIIDIHFSVIF